MEDIKTIQKATGTQTDSSQFDKILFHTAIGNDVAGTLTAGKLTLSGAMEGKTSDNGVDGSKNKKYKENRFIQNFLDEVRLNRE